VSAVHGVGSKQKPELRAGAPGGPTDQDSLTKHDLLHGNEIEAHPCEGPQPTAMLGYSRTTGHAMIIVAQVPKVDACTEGTE